MKIIEDLSIEVPDTNAYHWDLKGYSKESNETVLFYGFNAAANKNLLNDYSHFKRRAYFNNWAPCEFAQPVVDDDSFFNEVYSICPYTSHWLNDKEGDNRYRSIFYPYNAKIVPPTLEKKYEKTKRLAKNNEKKISFELNLIEKLIHCCGDGLSVNTLNLEQEEETLIKSFHLLTNKPILYAANVSERDIINNIENDNVKKLTHHAKTQNNDIIKICASIEQEISSLSNEDEKLFLKEYNLNESGLSKIIKKGFQLLNLHTFFTGGPSEVRAWTIPIGSTAKQSAGAIHSDFEKGFIKAEVFSYNDLVKHGSEKAVAELGLSRTEGKEYIVKDGDCMFFKFNV